MTLYFRSEFARGLTILVVMAQPLQLQKGIVKQLLSGDSVVIRGQPKGGPPPERILGLSGIVAPRLGRRATQTGDQETSGTRDEPYAFESREFLRHILIGKQVTFVVEHKVSTSGREYGTVWVTQGDENINVKELMVTEGLVEVRRSGIKPSEEQTKLIELEESAKAGGKGKWSSDSPEKHVREVLWLFEKSAVEQFVARNQGNEIDGVIEFVRDAGTMKVELLPSHQYITLMLSGVKTPLFNKEGEKQVPEPFAEEARFFVESRLLQRDVKVLLEGVSGQNVIGSILHPAGNITEVLLREGFARCVDWSMAIVSRDRDKLRAAEKVAKEGQRRIWHGYVAPAGGLLADSKEFTGKVVEVINADAVVIKKADGELKKLHLSSLRPPRKEKDEQSEGTQSTRGSGRILYDVPYMFEAREFLRKKLIGKKVNAVVDYIKPADNSFAERTCATISIGGINIAEALISKGFALTVRHKQDDELRSSKYDDLLAAEMRAKKNMRGVHSKNKESAVRRVADISGDHSKAKQFLPFLQRAGRSVAIVEFVASGSRLRLYIPKETCLITFLLAGISCPRVSQAGRSGHQIEGEPFGQDALTFTKGFCLQHDVEVEVDSMDKAGNFIGWLFVEGQNLSVALVEAGLASMHFTADRSKYARDLYSSEDAAKAKREKIWADYEEPKAEEEIVTEDSERQCEYQDVVVTEINGPISFWAQNGATGPELEKLMEQLRSEFAASPPPTGAYKPKKGDMCAAKFTDGQWYRARVEKIVSSSQIHILYIDFGNREETNTLSLASLPAAYSRLPPQATLYHLAFVNEPRDVEWIGESMVSLKSDLLNHEMKLNVEYKSGSEVYVTVVDPENNTDFGKSLVADGLLLVERRREKRLAALVEEYQIAQQDAKTARRNVWQYGDITADTAVEFGYQKSS